LGDNLKPLLEGSVTVALALGNAFTGAIEAVAVLSRGVSFVLGVLKQIVALLPSAQGTPEGIAGLEAKRQRRLAQDEGIRGNNAGALDPFEAAKLKLAAGLGTPLETQARLRLPGQEAGPRGVIVPLPPTRPDGLGAGRKRGGGGGADEPRNDRLEEVEAFIKALERSNRMLQAEVEVFGKGNVEREKAIALAKIGSDLTEEQRRKIEAVAESTGRYRDKLKEVEDQQRRNAEAARFFGDAAADALTDVLVNGEKADQVLKNLGKSLASAAIKGVLTGSGPFGFNPGKDGAAGGIFGLLGGLFGLGGKAGGGSVFGGTPYLVGENGPELFMPGQSGTIVPNSGLRGGSGGSSGPMTINVVGAQGNNEIRAMVARGVSMGIAESNRMRDKAQSEFKVRYA
jgi:hypothetical protein